jgi:hypothetical protein
MHWNGGLRLLSSEDTAANALAILQVVGDREASRQRLDELVAERKAADEALAKAKTVLADARALGDAERCRPGGNRPAAQRD